MFVLSFVLTFLFSLFYVTREGDRRMSRHVWLYNRAAIEPTQTRKGGRSNLAFRVGARLELTLF